LKTPKSHACKVATGHPKSRNGQAVSSPKPKKQPKTQRAKPESRNFHQRKSRNLKISSKQKTRKNLKNSKTNST